jgi:hypothetical protein
MNIEPLCRRTSGSASLVLAPYGSAGTGFERLPQFFREHVGKRHLTKRYQLVTFAHAPVPPP